MDTELIESLKRFVLKDNKCQNGKTYESVIRKHFPEIYESIKGKWFKEKLYMLLYDISEHPLCPVCHEPLPLRNWVKGFQKTCSKECLGKFQSISKEFAEKISKTHLKKNIKLNNLKQKYPDLNIVYNQGTKQYIVKDYCKHGDIIFQTNLNILDKLKSKGKCLCNKCNEEFIENYNPTEEDIKEFQNNIANFRNRYFATFSKEWFIRYYPKEYKIILDYTKNEDIPLIQRIILFQHGNHEIPECSVEGCHNKCKFGESRSLYYPHCEKHINYNWQSKGEKDLKQFLKDLNIEFESNNRTILDNGKEIDIVIPGTNIAIEYNGLFWHNEENAGKKSYLKFKECKEKGIHLITIWEDDWRTKTDIIKDLLRSKLGLNNKIYARECTVKEIDYDTETFFLEKNHLQGSCQSSIRLGVYYNDKLVAVMTFGKSRFKQNEYELLRFACLNGYNIIGGFSKLLKYFIRTNNFKGKIISYANCDISIGNVYVKNGFNKLSHSLNYWWCKNGEKHSRYKFMKHKLIKMGFDKDKSENEIMKELKYYKVFGTGNIKYELTV